MRTYSIDKMDHRMFDFKNYYDRVAKELPDGCRICEVGIADGASAIYLAETILNLGKDIERFVMIDSCAYGGQNQRNDIIRHLVKSGLGSIIEFWEMDSLNASCKFNDGYLHFVFLDSSHEYSQTKAELRCWYPKLLHDFSLSGHDYIGHPEVKKAVDEVVPAFMVKKEITENGCGVYWVKKDDARAI